MKLYLAVSFGWISLVFFLTLGKGLAGNLFFAALFMVIAILLAASLPRVNKVLYVLLLFWAIPFAPLIQIPRYGVYEDAIMFCVGINALVRLVKTWKPGSFRAIPGLQRAPR